MTRSKDNEIMNALTKSNKAMTYEEIANAVNCNKTNVSKMIKRLEQKSLVSVIRGRPVLVNKLTNNELTKKNGLTNNELTKKNGLTNNELIKKNGLTNNELTKKNGLTNKRLEQKSLVSVIRGSPVLVNKLTNNELTKKNGLTNNELTKKTNTSPGTILTVNSIWDGIIKFTNKKDGKGYERINKILKSHDNNRNYQSGIIRDFLEIMMEMGRVR